MRILKKVMCFSLALSLLLSLSTVANALSGSLTTLSGKKVTLNFNLTSYQATASSTSTVALKHTHTIDMRVNGKKPNGTTTVFPASVSQSGTVKNLLSLAKPIAKYGEYNGVSYKSATCTFKALMIPESKATSKTLYPANP